MFYSRKFSDRVLFILGTFVGCAAAAVCAVLVCGISRRYSCGWMSWTARTLRCQRRLSQSRSTPDPTRRTDSSSRLLLFLLLRLLLRLLCSCTTDAFAIFDLHSLFTDSSSSSASWCRFSRRNSCLNKSFHKPCRPRQLTCSTSRRQTSRSARCTTR